MFYKSTYVIIYVGVERYITLLDKTLISVLPRGRTINNRSNEMKTKYKYEVCYPSTKTVLKSFRTLKAAREFAKNITDKDLPFLTMPWPAHYSPITFIKRVRVV